MQVMATPILSAFLASSKWSIAWCDSTSPVFHWILLYVWSLTGFPVAYYLIRAELSKGYRWLIASFVVFCAFAFVAADSHDRKEEGFMLFLVILGLMVWLFVRYERRVNKTFCERMNSKTDRLALRAAIIGGVLIAVVPVRPIPEDPPVVSQRVFQEVLLGIADKSHRYPHFSGYQHDEVAHVNAFVVKGIRGRSLVGADIFIGGTTVYVIGVAPKALLTDLHQDDRGVFAKGSDVAILREIWAEPEQNKPGAGISE
ncbi:MAG: hypothetical protein JJU00_13475 [Opitutales bacterium]|nr:hypothetical protein [Opitutales bacterium]